MEIDAFGKAVDKLGSVVFLEKIPHGLAALFFFLGGDLQVC